MSKTLFNKLPDELARVIYSYIYADVMNELTKTIINEKIILTFERDDESDDVSVDNQEHYEFVWKNIYENCYIHHNCNSNIKKEDIENICIRQCNSCSFQSVNECHFSVWGYCYKNCYRPKY